MFDRLEYNCDTKSNLSENYCLEESLFTKNSGNSETNEDQFGEFGSTLQIDIDKYKEQFSSFANQKDDNPSEH